MTKARDLANIISAGSILSDGDIDPNEITGVTATAQEINYVSGVSSSVQTQLNDLSTEDSNIQGQVTTLSGQVTTLSGTSGSLQDQIDDLSDENLLNLGV